jgi:hypothetical protein
LFLLTLQFQVLFYFRKWLNYWSQLKLLVPISVCGGKQL